LPDLLRQAQQPDKHGRHHVQVRNAVSLDQTKQLLGIEARLQHG